MKFKRTASNCKECPLNRMNRVWGMSDVDASTVIILGEAPGANEDLEKKPFVGAAGAKLKEAVAASGLLWHTIHKTNVICCRPPNNDITSDEAVEAIKCCRPGFEQELAALKKAGARIIIPTGNTALKAVGIEGNISKVRGSVYPLQNGLVAVPTYHPSYILRGMWKEEPTWIADLAKAREISLKTWKPLKEKFNLFPTEEDVKKFCATAIAGKKLIAVDIETTSLSPYHSKIIMIGLAMNEEEALVVPFVKQYGAPYWTVAQESRVHKMLNEMFQKCPTMFQNASFDVRHLEEQGFTIADIHEDTMLAHHAIHPALPHNLEYIVSIYGKTPAWKAAVKSDVARLVDMDETLSRTYNARDTVVLHQVIPELHKDLNEFGTMNTYRRWSMRMLRPLIDMSKAGMLIDKKRLAKAKKRFATTATKSYAKLQEIFNFPEGFNIESAYHLQALVYGIKPANYDKWYAELMEYEDPASKKKKNTKKYAELYEKVSVYAHIKPLTVPKTDIRKTAGGYALDEEAMLQLQRAVIRRIEALKDRVRMTDEVLTEIGNLEKTLEFFKYYREYSTAEKLASTYSGYPLGPDGRVHPSYKIHGTETGRISASEPNLQNQPEEVQDVFVAGPGRAIVKADFANIEYRVMAIMTGERWLEEEFAKGVNFHDINTKLLFGIEKDDPQWAVCRRAAKTFIFGLSYGGTNGGIYKKILVQVPEMQLTLAGFTEIVKNYFAKMPNYAKWREAIQKQARNTRIVETAFGRKRILLGMPDEIERQALNTPIQGTAGEIAMESLCDLYDELHKPARKAWKANIVLTVHDSILVECEDKYKMDVAKLMKKVMEKEWTLCGRKVHFPVDIDAGPSWGECERVNLK